MTQLFASKWIPHLCLWAMVGLLYGQFLWNPIFFDDMNVLLMESDGLQRMEKISYSLTELRSLPYASLSWTKALFGIDLPPFRIGNLVLHALCASVLYRLIQQLLATTPLPKEQNTLGVHGMALMCAALFAVHPVSTYAAGYLIQRTILMAMLFGLAALLFYVKGSQEKRPALIWLAAISYYFAVYSKEQAVTLVGVIFALTVLMHEDWIERIKTSWKQFAFMLFIALMATLARKGILGSVYELGTQEILGEDYGPLTYPYSIITQCGLFFKYLLLWAWPNTAWMSIDMHEPYVAKLWRWQLVFVPLFLLWGVTGAWLLKQRQTRGLLGFAMLVPWLMFMTELSTVRVQDTFVLYRSYQWFPISLLVIPVALARIDKQMLGTVATAVIATLFVLSMERLATLSSPILVWSDAAKLIDGNPDARGVERIYYNLARHLMLADMLGDSEKYVQKALEIDPKFAHAYAIRGSIHIRKREWDPAIAAYTTARTINTERNEPPNPVYLMGRARAYEGAGQLRLAANDYLEACRIDLKVCEHLRKNAVQQ